MANGELFVTKISEKLKPPLHANKWVFQEEIFLVTKLNLEESTYVNPTREPIIVVKTHNQLLEKFQDALVKKKLWKTVKPKKLLTAITNLMLLLFVLELETPLVNLKRLISLNKDLHLWVNYHYLPFLILNVLTLSFQIKPLSEILEVHSSLNAQEDANKLLGLFKVQVSLGMIVVFVYLQFTVESFKMKMEDIFWFPKKFHSKIMLVKIKEELFHSMLEHLKQDHFQFLKFQATYLPNPDYMKNQKMMHLLT